MNDCLISKTKRQRVSGTGPRRAKLVPYADLGSLHFSLIEKLNDIADKNTGNDLGSDNYNISKQCNFDEVFNAHYNYRQILLQTTEIENTVNEYNYCNWIEDISIPDFKNVYRFRISEMQPQHELKYHIDADTSVNCRAQIWLNDNDSIFQFKDKEQIHTLHMMKNHMYFINTGWPHRVVTGKDIRRVAIFGFSFEDYIGKINLNV